MSQYSNGIHNRATAVVRILTIGIAVAATIAGVSTACAFDDRLVDEAAVFSPMSEQISKPSEIGSNPAAYAQLFGPFEQYFRSSAPDRDRHQNFNSPRARGDRDQTDPRDTYIRSRDRYGNPGPTYRVLGVVPRKPKGRSVSHADQLKLKVAEQLRLAPPAPPMKGPLLLVVSTAKQTVTLYDAGVAVAKSPVSTGTASRPTPTGIFSVIEKQWWHRSNMYSAAPMPFMQRITWSGVALHAGELPGYAASHGCIRLPEEFALRLWGTTRIGARVIITRNEVAPIEIAHGQLFVPKAKAEPAREPKPEEKTPPANKPQSDDISVSISAPAGSLAEHQTNRLLERAMVGKSSSQLVQTEPIIVMPPTFMGAGPRVIEVADAQAQRAGTHSETDEDEVTDDNVDDATKYALQQLELVDPDNTVINGTAEVAIMRPGQLAETLLIAVEKMPQEAAEPPLVSEPRVMLASLDASIMPMANQSMPTTQLARKRTITPQAESTAVQARVLRPGPVSVLISRKDQRMYVRKGFEPLFDVPISIANPNQPIGTHVFTAVAPSDDQAMLRWMVVSLEASPTVEREIDTRTTGGKRLRASERVDPKLKSTAAARTALNRLGLPLEAVERISELVSVGATLIISERSLSRRDAAALDSDFTVLTP